MLEELGVKAKLARSMLTVPWDLRWTALLVQWLSWDLLRASDVRTPAGPTSAGPSGQSCE